MAFTIKTYSKSEICNLYNISMTTLRTWLVKAKIETNAQKILTPAQVQELINHVGEPEKIV